MFYIYLFIFNSYSISSYLDNWELFVMVKFDVRNYCQHIMKHVYFYYHQNASAFIDITKNNLGYTAI